MQKSYTGLLLVLVSVFLVDIGQLFLKYGVNQVGSLDFSAGYIAPFLGIFSNIFVLIGVVLFVSSSLGWLLALSKIPLSYGYPIVSFGYVFVSLLSWIFFDETLSFLRVVGLMVIVGGVFLLARTER
ncbi:MAG: transporter [archaeon GW2011_AR17]|nr:MAG: transporter [archaeon GW2011_AR17]MBS3154367.1 EamA family transporter [Candidatus Woesearchaeota archaeon]HIH15422.1 EamA family transporter [Nanoarchaeota archaeon]HIH58910.1 EamA family transporter [Nanoarchaeota archaeon]HII13984.1 EamA family transporter [Nanoarchaeota archaeon]